VNKRLEEPSIPSDEAGPNTDDDDQLVTQARGGDQDAFRILFERYHRRAFAVALGVVRNRDDALDVVQDAFVKAHRHLDKFRGQSRFYTWLYRIVMNLAIDHMRQAKYSRRMDFEDAASFIERDPGAVGEENLLPRILGQDPKRSLLSKEIGEHVSRALDQLSENHRAVLIMREVDGLSYEEMAEVMQCAKGTIMSRLFHARRNMQRLLHEYVDGDLQAGQPDDQEDDDA
jgi:RNA polymerase sigma-70 factor (ECF subfamily)